ncbi:class I SAM-dependent methyltransferase [Natronorubrum thiooxidans]|uniref:Methyltransferase domain-containing protein n=1 Tax=Natronorubrum thiooxidans TaxID=308853 RepID=A0A1N7D919_9EURY|nr:class I SAM-dependent methyltransferase [Natronorubrum thiooxidans]SIR72308.1 Methyltransferase domain-containing protein [Natronorubrum thiooxidans]
MDLYRYNFGVYHWRRRFASIGAALSATVIATAVGRRTERRRRKLAAAAVGAGAALGGTRVATRALSPPPWKIDREKYEALASRLPLDDAARLLDVGCGTGRSLVGIAPAVPQGCETIGLDVFDDRIILGNGPRLARRNGRRAGLTVTPIAGDATRLPLSAGSFDVVTACRVLHDLEAPAVDRTLREIHRVCTPDGSVGILELPLVPTDVSADPETYWPDRVSAAGFRIDAYERIERGGGGEPYLLLVATPRSDR